MKIPAICYKLYVYLFVCLFVCTVDIGYRDILDKNLSPALSLYPIYTVDVGYKNTRTFRI